MNKVDLIILFKKLYTQNPQECNHILEEASNEYEKKAAKSKDFHKTIKKSPLYWEAKLNGIIQLQQPLCNYGDLSLQMIKKP